MIKRNKIKIEWIIIAILLVVVIISLLVILDFKKNEIPKESIIKEDVIETPKKDGVIQKYERLELAYNKTINEIESVVDNENLNLAILKENLTQILDEIKKEKEKINKRGSNTSDNELEHKTEQLEELLDMSKEVLAERLLETNEENQKLTIDNRKLHFNLKKSVENFEVEKKKNMKLNEKITIVKNKIKKIEDEGAISSNELKLLKREKKKYEKMLVESNKTIKKQNTQIQELGDIIRKVNIDCFFYYEKGNPMEEAKIYLTSKGVSERYVKYFIRKKPDIYIEFKMSADMIENKEKIELKMFNSLDIEVYSVYKLLSTNFLKIIVPNRNFDIGKYSVALKSGDENLILDKRYWFKIGS